MRSATLRLLPGLAALLAVVGSSGLAGAQERDSVAPPRRPDDDAVCLGFAFGAFTPKLDWEKAGHRPVRDSASLQHAPAGRDWAADVDIRRDSALYLFPSWWPVGIMVRLPNRRPAAGDTVSGTAIALVARGDLEAPTAKVKAWRVACGAPVANPRVRTPPADTASATGKRTKKIHATTGTRPDPPGILRRSP